MIVPDTNLLIYAYNDETERFEAARSWWEGLLSGAEPVGIPWTVSTAFLRLMTRPGAVNPPVTPERAVGYVREWFEVPHVVPIEPGPDHLAHLLRNLAAVGVGGNLVTDAHIAALAMEYQAEVHSADADFGRFPGLRWRNPL